MADAGRIETIDQLCLFTKVGTIAGSQNWSETTFRSTTTSNGGGNFSPASTSTTTSSSTAEQLRLFVRSDNGDEFEAKFSEPGFGVREGHRVSIVYAGSQAEQSGYAMALANHSTSQSKVFAERSRLIVDGVGQVRGCLLLISPIFILIFLASFLGALALIPAAIPVIWVVQKARKSHALAKRVTAAVTEELQKAIEVERNRAGV